MNDSLLLQKTIVDMHVHVAGVGAGGSGCYVAPHMRRNWRYRIYLRAFGVREQDLELHGDALVVQTVSKLIAESRAVKQAVILALDGVVDGSGELDLEQTVTCVPNEFVAGEVARHPNLLFGASVNPYRPDALQRLEKVVADGAVLLKWLPAIQHIDPADRRLVPFYRRLQELGLPLLTHAGHERSFSRAAPHYGDPQRLRLPLSLGVTVIAAHAATTGKSEGEDNMLRLIRMFPDYPKLYADISSLTQANKLFFLTRLLRHSVHDRLIYGTDFPLINTALVSPCYYPFRLSLGEVARIAACSNPWDKDVLLKRALGVPEDVFTRWEDLGLGRSTEEGLCSPGDD